MARIRTVKPEFWTDEKIVQLPYEARLLFIGIWNFADDHGYLWDEPERIRMQVLPNDDVDISGLLDLLCAADLLEVYESGDEKRIFRVTHFNDHQKVDHPTPSKITRESSRKLSIPNNVRRAIAKKYGCVPGGSNKAECYYCGSVGNITWWKNSKGDPGSWVSFSKLELDHLHPESKGGETSQDNIVLSCRECNRSKHDKDLMTFVMKSRDNSRTLAPEGKGREGNGMERILKTIDQKSDDFDRFWEIYPKKTAKIEAQKAWKKAKPDLQTVIKALAWQIKSRQWMEGYVPNPATYLNQGRWMDTPVNERTTKPDILLEKNRNNVEEWIPPEMRVAL